MLQILPDTRISPVHLRHEPALFKKLHAPVTYSRPLEHLTNTSYLHILQCTLVN